MNGFSLNIFKLFERGMEEESKSNHDLDMEDRVSLVFKF